MQKRGQVSVFVIIGIVAVAAIIFIFLLFRSVEEKAREVRGTEEYLSSQLGDLRREIEGCIGEVSNDLLDSLYDSGGNLNPERYANYYGKRINVLCYKVGDEGCYNFMFTKDEIVEQMLPVLEDQIKECADEKLFLFEDQDYAVNKGEFFLDRDSFVFDKQRLLITVNYPITLKKENDEQTEERFAAAVDTNFWQITNIANEIVNSHARGDEVDIVSLGIRNIYFDIGRTLYSGGSVYMIKSRYGDPRIFYFAVET